MRSTEGGLIWARRQKQVERSIREIVKADLGENGQLPSERDLVARPGAGRTTIRLVLMKLAAEGLIRSEQGQGVFRDRPKRLGKAVTAEPEPWQIQGERLVYDNP